MPTHDQDPTTEMPIAEPLRPAAPPTWSPDASPEPVATDAVAFSTRTGGPSKLRVGAVTGAAVALAVGAVATSLAASPATPAAGTAATSTVSQPATRQGGAPLAGGQLGASLFSVLDPTTSGADQTFDHGMMGGRGFDDITISSISGSNVTLKTADGWTRTIAVTGPVKVTKGGQDITVSDLAVGDQVYIQQTRNADGTFTVNALVVVVPSVGGTVSDVSSSGFKLTTRDGSVWTITVNGSTKVTFGTADGSMSDVKAGVEALVQGEKSGDNALTASSVRVPGDRATGTVKSKTSDSIVITKRDGSTVTVHVSADTTYRVAGKTTASLSDVTVGMAIGVSGRSRSDGSIDAATVVAGQGGVRGMGDIDGDGTFDGFGPGMMGGRGHGFGRDMDGTPGWDGSGGTNQAQPTPAPTQSS